jgi:hypothetical protein
MPTRYAIKTWQRQCNSWTLSLAGLPNILTIRYYFSQNLLSTWYKLGMGLDKVITWNWHPWQSLSPPPTLQKFLEDGTCTSCIKCNAIVRFKGVLEGWVRGSLVWHEITLTTWHEMTWSKSASKENWHLMTWMTWCSHKQNEHLMTAEGQRHRKGTYLFSKD